MSTRKTDAKHLPATPACDSPKTKPQYEAANRAFAEILADKNNAIFVACSFGLRQHNLTRTYDEAFVINEAYLRICKAIANNKTIANYPGWIRLTCRHVIKELSRAAQKKSKLNRELSPETVPTPEADDAFETEEVAPEHLRMRKALATLPPLDRAILQFKIVKGMRWEAAAQALVKAGYPEMSPNQLSQRKGRALKKLEKAYEAVLG